MMMGMIITVHKISKMYILEQVSETQPDIQLLKNKCAS